MMGFVVWFNLDWIIGKRFRQILMIVELQTKVIQKYFVIIGSNLKSREGGEGEREKHMKVMKYNFEILLIGTIMTHLLAPAATRCFYKTYFTIYSMDTLNWEC